MSTERAEALERQRIFLERARPEFERTGLSMRQFAELVKERLPPRTRGASYPGIRALFDGEIVRPRPNIVEAIAAVLGVNPAWLTGEGPRDVVQAMADADAEQATASAVEGANSEANERDAFREVGEVLAERIGEPYLQLPGLFKSALLEVWLRVLYTYDPAGEYPFPPPPEVVNLTATAFADALISPARLFTGGDGPPPLLTRWNSTQYIMAAAQALLTVLPDRHTRPLLTGFGKALMKGAELESPGASPPIEEGARNGDD